MEKPRSSPMSEMELLEFGVYHWVIGSGSPIPGLLPTGFPSAEFFVPLQRRDGLHQPGHISEWLESRLTRWTEQAGSPLLILCSGGVDSSSLVATAARAGAAFELLHTAYTNHDNNDLGKLFSLVQAFPSQTRVFSIAEDQYRAGLELLWRQRLLQNTYGPTITYALSAAHATQGGTLVTGSGPDEFFYGMEKYSFDKFDALKDLPVAESLESLDAAYNLEAYASVLNKRGLELLGEVRKKRRKLYEAVALQCGGIYDAQRMLAYCTVTSQHLAMFDRLAKLNGMTHFAPFMDEHLIRTVFAIPVQSLVNQGAGEKRVEIGKYHLKQFLARYMPETHVHSKKIGFHAPTTRFMLSRSFEAYFEDIKNGAMPDFFDVGKVRALLAERFGPRRHEPPTDYFLYSLLNVSQIAQR